MLLAVGAALAQPTSELGARLRTIQADPALTDAAIKRGAGVASFCESCHGKNGNSVRADIPNLAGQNPHYLLDQISKFASGERRNEFMQGLSKSMTANEKVDASLYYAHQPVTTTVNASAALITHGKAYYDQVCFRCHGRQGKGDEQYARLAGQQPAYVILTLKRYRDGSALRADPFMADATRRMSDEEISAVAAYIASIK